MLKISDDRLCKIKMIGEIRQNFTEASASVGLILATALYGRVAVDVSEGRCDRGTLSQVL